MLTKIYHLETQNKKDVSQILIEKLKEHRLELKQILINDYEKNLQHIKASFYSSGNKAGKMLAQLIKTKQAKTRIAHLIDPKTGAKISHPKDIACAFKEYYSSLYNLKLDTNTTQPSTKNIAEFLDSVKTPVLDPQMLEHLNAQITSDEIKAVLKSLALNKSPGPDGLSTEYYQNFSNILIPHQIKVFNEAISSSSLSAEMLKAIIVTLPKPGK